MEVNGETHGCRVYAAFVALAVLAGPVNAYADTFFLAAPSPIFAGTAISSVLAGVVLLAMSGQGRGGSVSAPQLRILLLLLLPQSCAVLLASGYVRISWMHRTGWGAALLIAFAAPLWLGLVSALEIVEVEVPRAVAAAAIAGIGAGLLVLPVESYALGWNQVSTFLLDCLLGIAMVISWTLARPRLQGLAVARAAGVYLLMSAAGYAILSLIFERAQWQPLAWNSVALPLAFRAILLLASWGLWFWLLLRLSLAAFGMRSLAAWAAAMAPGFAAFGLRQWRMDVAFLVAIASLVVALRARTAEEQPLALGLAGS